MKLIWSIRSSFVDYVRDSGGSIMLEGGVSETGEGFVFAPAGGTGLSFSGSVHFDAHGGMLDVTIGDPAFTIDGENGVITVTTDNGPTRTSLARLNGIRAGDPMTAQARLTVEGVRLLGDVYEPGSPLDPFTIVRNDA